MSSQEEEEIPGGGKPERTPARLYFVLTISGEVAGPLNAAGVKALVESWQVGPQSQIRPSHGGAWASMREVAATMDMEMPSQAEWERSHAAARSDGRSKALGCGVVVALVAWAGLSLIGLGFLFMPLLLWCGLYVSLALAFGAIAKVDVLAAPLWADMRGKPQKGGGLQFCAMALAMVAVVGWYLWRIYG